jgi:hypothetical protein
MKIERLNSPCITAVTLDYLAEAGGVPGYRMFLDASYAGYCYYAPTLLALILKPLFDFALYMGIRGIEMRLDAPEYIRANEGCLIDVPFYSFLLKLVKRFSEPIMFKRSL